MCSNIGYLYYKEYFTDEIIKKCKLLGKNEPENNLFRQINQKIINNSNIELLKNKLGFIKEIQDNLYDKHKIYLKTTYPGLIVGTGYSHIIKEQGEFKLGLELDYTTGLPVINGSSVKGMLRSMFYNEKDNEELRKNKEKYIKELLVSIIKEENIQSNLDTINFKELTYNIFEGKYNEKETLPISKRDIFFGATIDIGKTVIEINKYGKEKYILGEDYITPHGKGTDKLKNPNPIKFLKVMPNVVWCFGFDLKNQYCNEKDSSLEKLYLTANMKKELFEKIILDVGIGAKTNVGYGILECIE